MSQKIDNPNLDVIVIGAGPAGGSCARELAKLGRKVLIIERSQEIGEPNYSTAGTSKQAVETFGLPKKILSATWNRILIATPRTRVEWKYPETMGYVLDFSALRKFLAEDAAQNGAEILVGTSVTDFIIAEDGHIAGVKYHGVFGDGEARAKVIVDATGHSEFGNAKLKLNPMSQESFTVATEYFMTGLPPDFYDALGFFLGSEYAPGGYAWVFPMDHNKSAKVGIGAYVSTMKGATLEKLQERFVESLPYFKNMEPMEIHAGAARTDGGVKTHVYKNVVLVGDSARQVNPLGGEGIRHCLLAGRMAAQVISDSFKQGFCDEDILKNYEKMWKDTFGTNWRISALLSNIIYKKLNDQELDQLVGIFGKLSPEDAFEVFFNYNFRVLLKYPRSLTLWAHRKFFGELAKLWYSSI